MRFVLLAVCLLSTVCTYDDDDENKGIWISGGYFMDLDEAPWSASIQLFVEDRGLVPLCYGAIVSSTAIVTAAQCIIGYPTRNYSVRVGSWFSSSGGEVFEPKWLLTHEEYNPHFHTNDIGIMYLGVPITTDATKPVPLPFQGYDVKVGEDVSAIGWQLFWENEETDIVNEALQVVEAITMEVELCQKSNMVLVHEDVICAGDPEEELDSCFAYTGGALMDNEGLMVGIFSWSLGCQSSEPAGVYTKVSSHMDWLNDRLNVTWINMNSLAKLQLLNS